ncbi:hypothetical protein ACFP3Q_14440 [Nocardioides sp. GCM10027113]|uniref:hypothetical protein n=1 Tax=unclassified Nocardioides TaxID=2615069 RepID=UPI003617FD68
MSTETILAVGLVVLACVMAWVVHLAREARISRTTVQVLALSCALGLLAMLLSDWPSEVLSTFWADHSILAGILSTVLLVGLVFLVYEEREQRHQDALDEGLTGAGLGGIVDHLVDVEVALALVAAPGPPSTPEWKRWEEAGRPLRWLREGREQLHRTDSGLGAADPRAGGCKLTDCDEHARWRKQLVDQCVRRLLAGMRDWSPLIGASRNGVTTLLAVSEIRKDLMKLGPRLGVENRETDALLLSLRQRLRLLARFCEEKSGAKPHRLEVLQTFEPLEPPRVPLRWVSAGRGTHVFGKKWNDQLGDAHGALIGGGTHVD